MLKRLLIKVKSEGTVSEFMDALQGDFAQKYNLRKGRSGSFWNGRYHATAIESSHHLWACLRYVDLNMVSPTFALNSRNPCKIRLQILLALQKLWLCNVLCWADYLVGVDSESTVDGALSVAGITRFTYSYDSPVLKGHARCHQAVRL